MSKEKVIHFKIPIDKYGSLLIDIESIKSFYELVNKILSNEWIILFTPFDVNCSEKIVSVSIPENFDYNDGWEKWLEEVFRANGIEYKIVKR